jgi:hypothetical protein
MQQAFFVPHVYRVEALVHAELKDCRYREVGCSCSRSHIEWFRVSEPHARSVVEKWSEWVGRKPYEGVVSGRKGAKMKWMLKRSTGDKEIEKLCQPLEQARMPGAGGVAALRRSPRFNAGKRRDRWVKRGGKG